MTTQEVANRYYELSAQNRDLEIVAELYGENIECIEPAHAPMQGTKGKKNVTERLEQWFSNVKEVHDSAVTEPTIMGDHFSVGLMIDLTSKDGNRMKMEEIGVYQVDNGKIVKEQYFY
ncbi:MAG: nuclear transport factor 2 family protein [Bacteroidota bacterium]